MRLATSTALLPGLLILAGSAYADVVMPEPEDCPAGTIGATCHGGPHCAPISCQDNSGCSAGLECREASFCADKIYCVGMMFPDEDIEKYATDAIYASCAGPCTKGECRAFEVCLPPLPVVEPMPDVAPDADVGPPDTGTPDTGTSEVGPPDKDSSNPDKDSANPDGGSANPDGGSANPNDGVSGSAADGCMSSSTGGVWFAVANVLLLLLVIGLGRRRSS